MAVSQYDLFGAKTRWDAVYSQGIMGAGNPMPFAAKTYGLTIIDWDKSLQNRFIDMDTKDLYLPFQYMEQVPNWEKSSAFNTGEIPIGRYEPLQVYSNGEAQEITLPLMYHAECYDDDNSWSLKWIETLTQRLKSLMFPLYDDSYGAPPKCLFNLGNIFVNIPVCVRNVSVENGPPYDWRTGLSMLRKITIQCAVSYPMWQAIGMTQAFASTDAAGKVFAYKSLTSEGSGYTRKQYIGDR